jgi:hypothetical protein
LYSAILVNLLVVVVAVPEQTLVDLMFGRRKEEEEMNPINSIAPITTAMA